MEVRSFGFFGFFPNNSSVFGFFENPEYRSPTLPAVVSETGKITRRLIILAAVTPLSGVDVQDSAEAGTAAIGVAGVGG